MTIEQRDGASRHGVNHGAIADAPLLQVGGHGEPRHQRHAAAGRHHVAQRLQTGALEALILADAGGKAESHRLVPQTVTIGQHQQFLALEVVQGDRPGAGLGVMLRNREPHGLLIEWNGAKPLHSLQFGEHETVELPLLQPFEQHLGLLFVEVELQLGKMFA